MLSLLRARLVQPVTRLATVSGPPRLLATPILGPALLSRRAIASSAPVLFPTAKKPVSKSKKPAKPVKKPAKKPVKKLVKKPAKKVIAKRKTVAAKKKTVTPKVTREEIKNIKKPSPPKSGYLLFITKFLKAYDKPRTSLEDSRNAVIEAARIWRGFSDLEKRPFLDEYIRSRADYENKLAAWSRDVIHNRRAFRAMNASRVKRGRRSCRLPKAYRRPVTPFLRFYQDNASSFTQATIGERGKEAGKQWKSMSEAQKRVYVQAYQKDLAKYKSDYAA